MTLRSRTIGLWAAAWAALACGCGPAPSTSSGRADSGSGGDSMLAVVHHAVPPPSVQMAQVESTLVRFSLALAAGDSESLADMTGDRFALIEDGRILDRGQMIGSARHALESGALIRTPVDFEVELVGPIAWTRYHVVGEFRTTEGKRTLISQLESAVLQRHEGVWRVMQMSTMPEVVK